MHFLAGGEVRLYDVMVFKAAAQRERDNQTSGRTQGSAPHPQWCQDCLAYEWCPGPLTTNMARTGHDRFRRAP